MNEKLDAALLRRMTGLLSLAQASLETATASSDALQFAVEINVLRNGQGLTNEDLRWLVLERLAEQWRETTRAGSRKRTFCKSPALKLASSTCFVVSPKGMSLVRRIYQVGHDRSGASELKPHWNPRTGDWTFDGRLIKHLRDDADAQRKVLDQCQTENWADDITNPFADLPTKERGHYLGQTLFHLNSNQREAQIKISACKKSRCIRWRFLG
jgi:hypothetical protein